MKIRLYHFLIVGFAATTFLLVMMSKNIAVEGAGTLKVSVDPADSDIVVFKWDGVIDPPMAKRFSEEFEIWKGDAKLFVIDLNSPGGRLNEGENVIRFIRKMKKTHSVETYVGPDGSCLSMCVPVYLQADMRVASKTSQWMFHEAGFSDTVTGQTVNVYAYEKRQASVEFFNRYLKRSEIDRDWLDYLQREWRGREVWKTGKELKDERANIVMVVE